jgi:Protein of unknown function (DUF3093)
VPWWVWPLGSFGGTVAGAELALGAPGLRPAAIAGGTALALAGMVLLSRIRIEVHGHREDGGELRVDDARLPLQVVAGASVVEPDQRRDLLGPGADPLAFVVMRP